MAESTSKKQIVILGAGLGGCSTVVSLEKLGGKNPNFQITLVAPRNNYYLHKIAGLRLGVLGDKGWEKRVMIPLDSIFKNKQAGHKFVHAAATGVDEANKTVTLDNGQTIPFDILVVATGSRNFCPGDVPAQTTSKEDALAYYQSFSSALNKSKSVCIVGSGPVGLELCGEVRNRYPKTKITVVSKGKSVLEGGDVLELPDNFYKKVDQKVRALGVEFNFQDEVVSGGEEVASADRLNGIPWQATPNGVTLKSGKKVECDLLVFAVGVTLSTQFLPQNWLDPTTKEVVIDEFNRVHSTKNIFCLGDIAKTNFTKLGYITSQNAPGTAKNIVLALAGQDPTEKTLKIPGVMSLPLGPKKGQTALAGMKLGNYGTALFKAKGLFTKRYWIDFGNNKKNYPAAKNKV